MSTKHSPGPWHLHVNAADDLEVNTAKGATVVYWPEAVPTLAEGDAHLIAAAPEMLEALREGKSRCDCPCGDCHWCSKVDELIKRIDG